ncbi:MAG: rhomboid family intramembrane serine protease [Bacteroidetes bacterium]|nr:rhomboid family intramembrane serine protease [Bacteroidota bacterium]
MAEKPLTTKQEIQEIIRSFIPIGVFLLLIWITFFVFKLTGISADSFALFPRSIKGSWGILFTPFIHGGYRHIASNSIPLLVLGVSLFYFYKEIAYRVFVLIYLGGDLLVWLIGRPSYHIGASGIVYGMAAFLIFSAFMRKKVALLAIAMIMVYLFGNMIWGILPVQSVVSWEAHLSGSIVGLICAYVYRKHGPKDDAETVDETDENSYDNFDDIPPAKRVGME